MMVNCLSVSQKRIFLPDQPNDNNIEHLQFFWFVIPDNCFFPFVNVGSATLAQLAADSLISNPRYSQAVNKLKSLLFSVRYLLLTLPPQPSEIKLTVPYGVIPMRYQTVLWCLYKEYVWARASKLLACYKNFKTILR